MTELSRISCVPCRGGIPPLTAGQIASYMPQVPAWRVLEKEGIQRLGREFAFPDFRAALDFTVQIGELAEREDHHPEIHLSWGKVAVEIWTHKIRGLHENDFILAAKIDQIRGRQAAP